MMHMLSVYYPYCLCLCMSAVYVKRAYYYVYACLHVFMRFIMCINFYLCGIIRFELFLGGFWEELARVT